MAKDDEKCLLSDCTFIHLPKYANFILTQRIEYFVRRIVEYSFEVDLPLLRHPAWVSRDDLVTLSMTSNRALLEALATNDIAGYINYAKENWLANMLPVVAREQILSDDITLVSHIRRTVFLEMLAEYSTDPNEWALIMKEIDRFTVMMDSTLLNTYLLLQQNRIEEVGRALKGRESDWLEAQAIGKIGSFEWDLIANESHNSPQCLAIFEITDDATYPLEKFIGYVHEDDRQKVKNAFEESLITGNYKCEFRYHRNGIDKFLLLRGKIGCDNERPARIVGTVIDMTEKQSIIRKLEASEELNKQAQALTHIGNWSLNPATGEMAWSDELYRIFGMEPQSENLTLDSIQSFFQSDHGRLVATGLRYALLKGKVPEGHFRISRRDGGAKIIKGKGAVTFDKNGKAVRVAGTAQDVTTEFLLTENLRDRERYLDALNRSLAQKNVQLILKNKELESFNFIASHDLQEPLRKIQIFSNRILQESADQLGSDVLLHIEKIRNAASRMQKLIDDFLSFSQTQYVARTIEPVDLNTVLKDVRIELQPRIAEKKATFHLEKLPVIEAIRYQIKQLFVNLVSNSLKYTHPDKSPHITIDACKEKNDDQSEVIVITYRDNGIGFEQKYAEKVFELFQRLHNKNNYSGTGIGLALCRRICENHNGSISVTSEPMQGCTFTIKLPVRNS